LTEELKVMIERRDPNGTMLEQPYQVPDKEGQTVLQVLENLFNEQDPTLAFQFSCRTGLCATCAMRINGKTKLSCMTLAVPGQNDLLRIQPIPSKRVIRDLITR
jgi:succinate dehydrogenase/fumarate reductase-like Fe-S protein